MRSVSSAFWARLQEPSVEMVELIDLVTPNGDFHWTTANVELTATWSGASTRYAPFPGRITGFSGEDTEMRVPTAQFAVVNSGSVLAGLLASDDISAAEVVLSRTFAATPGLGRLEVFRARVGQLSWNRDQITGQARGTVDKTTVRWPPYSYHDKCSWRFGGTGCGINASSYTITLSPAQVTVGSSSRSALWLTTASYAADYFAFGKLTCMSGANSGSARTVRVHTGNSLLLSHPLPFAPAAGDVWALYPGCRKRLIDDCASKYNNSGRFLGFPWIPLQEDGY